MRELVELGVSWVWMGLESPRSCYPKLHGADTLKLTRELRAHGIKLLGSTIVGLEHHTPENIHDEIEHAVALAGFQRLLFLPLRYWRGWGFNPRWLGELTYLRRH